MGMGDMLAGLRQEIRFTREMLSPGVGINTRPRYNGLDAVRELHTQRPKVADRMALQCCVPHRHIIREHRFVNTKMQD